MNTSIWKRLNTTLATSIAALIVATVLAAWIVHERSRSEHVSERLKTESFRIRYDAMVISESLSVMILDPRNEKLVEIERNHVKVSFEDLKDAVSDLQTEFADEDKLRQPLKNLQEFFLRSLK